MDYYNTKQFYFCCKNKIQANSFVEDGLPETVDQKCLWFNPGTFVSSSGSAVILTCDHNYILQKIKQFPISNCFKILGLKTGIMYSSNEFTFNYSKEYNRLEDPDCCTLIQEVNLKNFDSMLESLLATIYRHQKRFIKI